MNKMRLLTQLVQKYDCFSFRTLYPRYVALDQHSIFICSSGSIESTQILSSISNSRTFVTRSKKLREIGKSIGLPEKPKKPPTAYNRFFKDTYTTLKDLENKKRSDVVREIAALWKQCDASKVQQYKDAFEKDQVNSLFSS